MHPLEQYLAKMAATRPAAVAETGFYPALCELLDAVGHDLKPQRVRCVVTPASLGAGLPDAGLFTAQELAVAGADERLLKQRPFAGVVEAKGLAEDVRAVAGTEQEPSPLPVRRGCACAVREAQR